VARCAFNPVDNPRAKTVKAKYFVYFIINLNPSKIPIYYPRSNVIRIQVH